MITKSTQQYINRLASQHKNKAMTAAQILSALVGYAGALSRMGATDEAKALYKAEFGFWYKASEKEAIHA